MISLLLPCSLWCDVGGRERERENGRCRVIYPEQRTGTCLTCYLFLKSNYSDTHSQWHFRSVERVFLTHHQLWQGDKRLYLIWYTITIALFLHSYTRTHLAKEKFVSLLCFCLSLSLRYLILFSLPAQTHLQLICPLSLSRSASSTSLSLLLFRFRPRLFQSSQ